MYKATKQIICAALRCYFSRIVVRGAPEEQGALVIVGNHQNMALDSFVISYPFHRELWYLGKATLFKNPLVRAILKGVHVAPLYRRQDDPTQLSKNSETFSAVSELLQKNRAVLLFPEGVSLGKRELQPIKTGAARMAFQAESDTNFSANVRIQPAGITYSDPALFRSSVTIVFGELIQVSAYRAAWERDPAAAVHELTAAIEEGLRKVSVEIKDVTHTALVEKIAKLYQGSGTGRDDFERIGLIAKNVQAVGPEHPELQTEVENELDRFADLCALFKIGTDYDSRQRRTTMIAVALLSPLTILGAIIFWPPYQAIGHFVRKVWKVPLYYASGKLVLGLIIFPLWIVVLTVLALCLGASLIVAIGLMVFMAVAGIAANNYLPHLHALLLRVRPGEKSPFAFVAAERARIISRLEELRVA